MASTISLVDTEFPSCLVGERQQTWAVATAADPDGVSGANNVFANDAASGGTVRLMVEPGRYSPPAAAVSGDRLCVAVASWQEDTSRILLISRDPRGTSNWGQLTEPGRHENPAICIHRDRTIVAWETRYAKTSALAVVDASAERVRPIHIPVIPGRCYRPVLASNGEALFLFFEQFHEGRYRLKCCAAPDLAQGFGEALDIGFAHGNDMSPTVAVDDNSILVAWENSVPLRRGWTHAAQKTDITMPGFGHGWRVETKMGLRRVRQTDGAVVVEDSPAIYAPMMELGTNASAGCPTIIALGDHKLAVAYLTLDGKRWRVEAKQWTGDKWCSLKLPPAFLDRRVSPAVILDDAAGQLIVHGLSEGGLPVHVRASLRANVGRMVWNSQRKPRPRAERARLPHAAPTREVVHDGKSLKLLWGDLHMHTNLSGCSLNTFFHCTEPEEKYRFCRDVARLDFAMITDHAESMSPMKWRRSVEAADRNYEPGHFVSFVGYEWTANGWDERPVYGHYNVLFRDHGPLLSSREPDSDTPARLWAQLAKGDALTIPHHPGAPGFPVDWSFHNPDFVPLVEIFQVRGSYEYANCPMGPQAYGRTLAGGPTVAEACVRPALNRGYRLGFTSGGEHEGVGVTAVYAEELTRGAIFDALRRRHVYGTTGDRIFIDFRVNGELIGGEIPASSLPNKIEIHVHGTSDLASITLVRDGEEVQRWLHLGDAVNIEWTDDEANVAYYYAVIHQTNGEMAWTSPVFVG